MPVERILSIPDFPGESRTAEDHGLEAAKTEARLLTESNTMNTEVAVIMMGEEINNDATGTDEDEGPIAHEDVNTMATGTKAVEEAERKHWSDVPQLKKLHESLQLAKEEARQADVDTRTWVYANMDGILKKARKWKKEGHSQLGLMKQLEVSTIFVTETHGSYANQGKEEEEISQVMQEQMGDEWTTHLCSCKHKAIAGVGMITKKDWRYTVYRGITEEGAPQKEQDEHNLQGRYMIVASEEPGDIKDFMVCYVPNTGGEQRMMEEQRVILGQIKKAGIYWRDVLKRQLIIVSDSNYSRAEDRRAKSGGEEDIHEVSRRKGCTQLPPSARDSEVRAADDTVAQVGASDIEKWRSWTERDKGHLDERPRTTTEMDLNHLEPVKEKRSGRSPGPNKWLVRCDYVMAIGRGWQDETMWDYDATKGKRLP